MTDVFTHPEVAQLVDSLVASGGGLVSYAFGAPGRQIAAAAGARLAADSGTSLTVVDFQHLLPQMRSVVDEVRPGLACTVISAGEAVQQPRSTDGVLVVHAEVLHDPRTREALLAMAATADSLIVASSDGFDEPALDDLAIPRFVFRPSDLMPPVPHEPEQRPGRVERREPAPPHDAPPHLHDIATWWAAAPAGERGQRLLRQASPEAESGQDTVNYKELADLIQNADPDELSRRIEGILDQQRQRAADHPALAPRRPAARDHGQEQATAHQQHHPQAPGRT